ncbi:hypothetical protein ACIQRK_24200 [Streptomyces anulatus]
MHTHNTVGDASVGVSVQAGTITGGVSFYTLPPEPPPPRQLPLPPAWWVDRETDLALLHQRASTGTGTRVIAVHGPAGAGTTALASRVLHELQPTYPGGQLYVDMRGGEPDGPLTAGRALGRLLRSVRPGPPPDGTDERAAWWRSAAADRAPMCLLLDNAVDAAAVRACLPGGIGHLVIVTSRRPLADLGADGAYLHRLGPLPPDAAYRYLADRSGEARLRADPRAAEQLVQLAGGLPAALAMTAAQLSLDPLRPLSGLARALADTQRRAAPTPHAHPSLGAILTTHLDTAYARLDPDTAQTCRDLGRLPVHDIDATLAAAVRDITPEEATGHLTALAAGGLLEHPSEREQHGTRYRFGSPELRERVLDLARGEETDGEADQVLGRALGWALAAAVEADKLVTESHYLTLGISSAGLPHTPRHPVVHPDADAALGWLTARSESLLALVRSGAQASQHAYVWRLVYSMWPWWRAASSNEDWAELHALALESVDHDPTAGELAERHLMNTYGLGLRNAGDPIAVRIFTQVWGMAQRAGDALGEAQALYELGATHLVNDDAMEAVPLLERARRIRVERGYGRGVALADILLGQADLHLARVDQALHRFQGARAALLVVDAHDAARALAWQGRTHLKAGDVPAGEAALRTAEDEFLAARSPHQAGRALEWAGNAAEEGGRLPDARIFYDQALTHYLPVDAAAADRVREALGRLA